jgi:hypothetical protein
MAQTSLIIGDTNWAVKEDSLLGYNVIQNKYLPIPIDTVRATTATRVNEQGLIEIVPRNLIEYSEQLDNAVWIRTNLTVTPNATTAPNGTLTAEKLIPTVTNDLHITESSVVSFVSGSIYTFSFYAKRAEDNFIQITASSSLLSTRANFNLLNGTLGFVDSGITATITPINNDWYRCTASFVAAATGNFRMVLCNIPASTSARFATFAGNGTSGVFVWGCQVDNGSVATEYFPTTNRLDIPRIDYSTGTAALLVESGRTNLATNSDGNVSTYGSAINVTNASSSFNSFTNAIQFPSTGLALSYKSVVTTAQTYAISVFIKMDDNSVPILSASQTTGNFCLVIAGAIATNNLKVESYGNNVYRLSATATSGAVNINNGLIRYDTQVLKSFKITGIQLEAGAYPTSYIPTLASSVSRNSDLISKTGVSGLVGTEFTIFFDGFESIGGSSSRYIVLKGSGGLYANLIIIEQTPTNLIAAFVNDNSSSSVFASYSSQLTSGQRVKFALRCKNNDFAFYVNGQLRNAQASGTVPTTSTLYLGYYPDYADNYNIINSSVIYNSALTNAEMAQLTTL